MRATWAFLFLSAVGCAPAPAGLAPAEDGPGPRVRFDVFEKPLPEVPLPNDFATRFDALSPTLLRLNASVMAGSTRWEQHIRATLDGTSGWGTLAPITVAFDAPLDLANIRARHQAPTEVADDVLYVFDVTPGSPDFCEPQLLDLGQGHFPVVADSQNLLPEEPHRSLQQMQFEQEEEDLDGDGVLDVGEDTDMDGVLDHPNTMDPQHVGPFDVVGFYERETHTLIARPLYPLREKTRYAVVLTTRLKGADGNPVRSPFAAVNHLAQTHALSPLPQCLERQGLTLAEVAFTWSFTTQSTTEDYRAVRDGFAGLGPMKWLKDKYPDDFATLETCRHATADLKNVKIVPGAQFMEFGNKLLETYGGAQSATTKQLLTDFLSFVDFYAAPTFTAPQYFPRDDADGKPLPLYQQVFSLSPTTGQAFTRDEAVRVFLSVPKNRQGPAPVVIFMHGHSGSKLDSLIMMGPFARFGMATIGMDAVSHGLGLNQVDRDLARELVRPYGIDPLAEAILKGRAYDQNGDGVDDPGADYFTAYVSHTRDEVKQTVLDLMRMVRILRSFDGQRRWAFDANRDGEPDIAGDFDGDGVVDLGGPEVPIYVAGASLGGLLASLVGGVEPEVQAILPILPGGYLSEIGSRTSLGQVRNPLNLRMVAPLMLVHPDAAGAMSVFELLPDAVRNKEVKVATLPQALTPGSVALVRNLSTQEWRCGRVQPNGHLRLAVSSDQGDPLRLEFYQGELPTRPREGCDPAGATPLFTVDAFEADQTFQAVTYAAGSPLIALADGFGLRPGSPELRRFLGLGQIILESADPANFAPNYEQARTLTYGDGSTVATRALMVPMTGDPGVPIATAAALLRAAGLLDYKNIDPRYGKTDMQQLIDVGFVEGVERSGRYQDAAGHDVLMDVDGLQAVAGKDDGFGAPRLTPPMRLFRHSEVAGGTVGALFPYMNPKGEHSFPIPDPAQTFDLGTLMINIFATYLGNGGTEVRLEACMERSNCEWFPPVPQ